jgi:hypothetical protein
MREGGKVMETTRTMDVIDYDPTTGEPVAVLHGDKIYSVTEMIARPECPACGTRVDEDGYCTDAGCENVGKSI